MSGNDKLVDVGSSTFISDTSSTPSPSDYPVGRYDGYSIKETGLIFKEIGLAIDETVLKEIFADKGFYIHENASNGFAHGGLDNTDNLQGTFTQLTALQPTKCNPIDPEYINFITLQAYKRTDLKTGVIYANYKPYTATELESYIMYTNDTYIVYDMLPLLIDVDIDDYIRSQYKHKSGNLDCSCLPEGAVDWIIDVRKKVLAADNLIVKSPNLTP